MATGSDGRWEFRARHGATLDVEELHAGDLPICLVAHPHHPRWPSWALSDLHRVVRAYRDGAIHYETKAPATHVQGPRFEFAFQAQDGDPLGRFTSWSSKAPSLRHVAESTASLDGAESL